MWNEILNKKLLKDVVDIGNTRIYNSQTLKIAFRLNM
jgi:hypothetical protein